MYIKKKVLDEIDIEAIINDDSTSKMWEENSEVICTSI
jgi:hypothetical protein